MERNKDIENIGKNLCDTCKRRIEEYYKKKPSAGMMALYVLRVCCPKCKQQILIGAKKVHGT